MLSSPRVNFLFQEDFKIAPCKYLHCRLLPFPHPYSLWESTAPFCSSAAVKSLDLIFFSSFLKFYLHMIRRACMHSCLERGDEAPLGGPVPPRSPRSGHEDPGCVSGGSQGLALQLSMLPTAPPGWARDPTLFPATHQITRPRLEELIFLLRRQQALGLVAHLYRPKNPDPSSPR